MLHKIKNGTEVKVLPYPMTKGIKRIAGGWRNGKEYSVHRSFIGALIHSYHVNFTIAELAHALSREGGPTLHDCYVENPKETFRIVNKLWLDELNHIYSVERMKIGGKTVFKKRSSNLKKRLTNLRLLQVSLPSRANPLWRSLSDAIGSFMLLRAIPPKKW